MDSNCNIGFWCAFDSNIKKWTKVLQENQTKWGIYDGDIKWDTQFVWNDGKWIKHGTLKEG